MRAERGRLRVLHVVEALGGGVSSALEAYFYHTPEVDHYLLAHVREAHDVGAALSAATAGARMVPSGVAGQTLATLGQARALRPHCVHLHSSWAGAYGRFITTGLRVPAVYSPHGFAFLRSNHRVATRRIYVAIERLLAMGTAAFAVAGRAEADLARGLTRSARVFIAEPALSPRARSEVREARFERAQAPEGICTLGRICPQKDPAYFLALLSSMRERGWRGSAVWIGAGSSEDERPLRQAGVRITGWVPRRQALKELSGSRLYVHSAAWEAGVPYSLLEASAMGLPVAARDIPVMHDRPGVSIGEDPSDLAAKCLEILTSPAFAARQTERSRMLTAPEWSSAQRDGLLAAWEWAASRQKRQPLT